MMQEQSALWIGPLALLPIGLLLVTGLTFFVLPYGAKQRDVGRIGG